MSTPRLVLYGHFGIGNFGNDGTFEAMLLNVQKYQPLANITCVCTGTHVISERYGIQTLPVDVSEDRDIRQKPSGRLPRVKRLITRFVDEIDFWLRRPLWFRSIDQFIVVGTGAVDAIAISPWNAPYDLFKWCMAAKLGGARVVFLSVGAGPIKNRVSRILMLSALRVADYRSYREVPSVEYLCSVGFDTTGDTIYPDLVFSLPVKAWGEPCTSIEQPQTVGLGVIGYYGWQRNTSSGESIYQNYLAKLKGFMGWMLDQGHVVRLLIGNLGTDERPANELFDFVRREGQVDWQDRIFAERITDVHDLFRQIAKCDVVVANRFHNILCALMMGRPVISIGYHEKNDALMAEMGLQSYCQHIKDFNVERLIQQFQSLALESSEVPRRIQQRSAQYRQMLDEQYRKILLSDMDGNAR